MKLLASLYVALQEGLTSPRAKHVAERIAVALALAAFVLHLALIGLGHFGWVQFGNHRIADLLTNPIAAIYTPFSFILIYEVYLLVYYLPKSITQYIAKQYEIIALIIIRRVFKDIANLRLREDWFRSPSDLQFTCDIAATLVLFLLIIAFHRLARDRPLPLAPSGWSPDLKRFILYKKLMSLLLVPILLFLAIHSLIDWVRESFFLGLDPLRAATDVNKVFFEDFFAVLVMADVFLLLLSLLQTDRFPKVMRNSGFVISTILIKISFGATGLMNDALILGGVAFGVGILWAHNVFERTVGESDELAPPDLLRERQDSPDATRSATVPRCPAGP